MLELANLTFTELFRLNSLVNVEMLKRTWWIYIIVIAIHIFIIYQIKN